MKIIDALGKPCPMPVVEAKRALSELKDGGIVILVDNMTAVENLEKMSKGKGLKFECTQEESNVYEVSIELVDGQNPFDDVESSDECLVCSPEASGSVVAIGRDTMGSGDEELGKILIKGFIYSLTELSTPPKAVIFFNSGAKLSVEGSNALNDIRTLEGKGSVILTCGTCLNFYGIQDKLAVGTVTNMYTIVETMCEAGKVINI